MDGAVSGRLEKADIHGFHTLQDLDVANIKEEARMRWLRPNEIHAILCNHKYFTINVKPVNLPKGGEIVLFDRKMLRNFRKDGHNWKKKKDGKTIKEAHEHLKVGNEERIHVYYAHGQDNPTFVRRCYWLLDKTLEHIVLVHYRETRELQASPVTPLNSNSSSVTDQSPPRLATEEFDSGAGHTYYSSDRESPVGSLTVKNHEMTLHEINTLEWDELLVPNNPDNSTAPEGGKVSGFDQSNQIPVNATLIDGGFLSSYNLSAEISSFGDLTEPIAHGDNMQSSQTLGGQANPDMHNIYSSQVCTADSSNNLNNDRLQSQDSFGQWMSYIMTDTPASVDDPSLESSMSSSHATFSSPSVELHLSSVPDQIFTVTDFSPSWACTAETTKVLVTGTFHEEYQHLKKSNLFCVCGDVCVPAEIVQVGVYRCFVLPNAPGVVNLYMSFDGQKPISQILSFEYRTPILHDPVISSEDKTKWEDFQLQIRLAYLLFSKPKSLDLLSSKVLPNALKEAKKFADKTSNIANSWAYLIKAIENNRTSFALAKDSLFELTLKNRLKEWLLERIVGGHKSTEYDDKGQGVIHLCAILGYTWAIRLFSLSGLSLDFRDKLGWTALHWAARYGREKMVAVLLSSGAKPNLVTDPTSKNPSGCTPADLAYMNGYEGLAAYLSEKALVAQFEDMSVAGNISGTLQTHTADTLNQENISEEELYLKDSLAAYRTAADAAARIQVAFREHSLKVRTTAVEISNPEYEARNIIAAMKIQHAFRNFETKKKMAAATRIQYRFRSWKIRKEFLNMRRQAIRIQAAFRAFQVRMHYRKILWSVGVLEKAVLRWRLKRKGFRGLQVAPVEAAPDQRQESDTEEDFYRTSRKQAEERVVRAVVRVQAMFRSKKAQQEYRQMKLAHNEAQLEYDSMFEFDPNTGMEISQ